MTWFVILWGCLATTLGGCFLLFRQQVSAAARRWRASRGGYVGPNTQSPAVIAAGGAFFLVVGPLVIIAAATGLLHTH